MIVYDKACTKYRNVENCPKKTKKGENHLNKVTSTLQAKSCGLSISGEVLDLHLPYPFDLLTVIQ